jgi:hypothetical protein
MEPYMEPLHQGFSPPGGLSKPSHVICAVAILHIYAIAFAGGILVSDLHDL